MTSQTREALFLFINSQSKRFNGITISRKMKNALLIIGHFFFLYLNDVRVHPARERDRAQVLPVEPLLRESLFHQIANHNRPKVD